jgi:EAL domain-containing protein (putative c-di-GMP-specific phosphodiesterase class I)
VAAQVAPDRAAASRAITSLGNGSSLSASTLQSRCAEISGGLVGPTEAVQRLEGFDVAITAAVTRGLVQLEAQAHQPALVAALESLRAASDLLDVATPQVVSLKLHYQPVLDAASGALVGVEALIRWDRPGHGLPAPDSFPIAEATALIIDLDCWVLNEATRQLVAWPAVIELADIPVEINISGRHLLSRQLPDHMRAALDQTGIDPHRLTIEITETVMVNDLVAAATELDAVRAVGVKAAIDDFGTGYTSLAHFQQLPIDTIKIDRSFVSQLNGRRRSSLVRMVTELGHAIDLNIVAEGVETDEEMTALQAMGADHLQGFLLSRPLEPPVLSTWVHGRAAAAGQP